MKFKLSDAVYCDLGYDDAGILDAEPIRRELVRKCCGKSALELTPDEFDVLVWDVDHMQADHGAAKGRATATKKRLAKLCRELGMTDAATRLEW
jgi:hypothetical protein